MIDGYFLRKCFCNKQWKWCVRYCRLRHNYGGSPITCYLLRVWRRRESNYLLYLLRVPATAGHGKRGEKESRSWKGASSKPIGSKKPVCPGTMVTSDLSASLDEMKKFRAIASLKGAIHTVMWSVRNKFLKKDYEGLAKQFRDWDESDEALQPVSTELTTEVKPTLKFNNVYELQEKLHQSAASAIWRCIHKHKKQDKIYAVKVVDRKKSSDMVGGGEAQPIGDNILRTISRFGIGRSGIPHPQRLATFASVRVFVFRWKYAYCQR